MWEHLFTPLVHIPMGLPMGFILMLADLPKIRAPLLYKLRQPQPAQLKATELLISGRLRGEVPKCTSYPLCRFYTLNLSAQKVCEELSYFCPSYQLNMTLNSLM